MPRVSLKFDVARHRGLTRMDRSPRVSLFRRPVAASVPLQPWPSRLSSPAPGSAVATCELLAWAKSITVMRRVGPRHRPFHKQWPYFLFEGSSQNRRTAHASPSNRNKPAQPSTPSSRRAWTQSCDSRCSSSHRPPAGSRHGWGVAVVFRLLRSSFLAVPSCVCPWPLVCC